MMNTTISETDRHSRECKKITVIISVYNGASYLAECLDSVLHQTYRKLEIILINDGSTDSSDLIARQYAEKDDRIHFISHSENKGLGYRRNEGIAYAHGEYIGFCDADDTADSDMFEKLFLAIEENDADMSVCRLRTTREKPERTQAVSSRIINGRTTAEYFLTNNWFGAFSWNKLFKRDLLQMTGKYPEGMLYEDIVFIPQVCMNARKCAVIDEALYYYRQHKSSITGSLFDPSKMDRVQAYDMLLPAILSRFPDLKELAHARRFTSIMEIWTIMIKDSYSSPEFSRILREKAKESRIHFTLAQTRDKKRVLLFDFALVFPLIYRIAVRLLYTRFRKIAFRYGKTNRP